MSKSRKSKQKWFDFGGGSWWGRKATIEDINERRIVVFGEPKYRTVPDLALLIAAEIAEMTDG